MEQKKVLLVVVSVGAFLAIAIVAGMFLFAPKDNRSSGMPSTVKDYAAPQETAASAGPASVDANEWVRNPSKVEGLQPSAQQSTSNRGDVIIIYGEKPNVGVATQIPDVNQDGRIVMEVPYPVAPAVPAPIVQPSAPPSAVEEKPAAAAPATRTAVPAEKQPPAVKAIPKKTVAAAKPAAAKPAAKLVDEYWVQTGSFSAKVRAENATAQLKSKGISALVETKEVNGKTFYRVRLGPYSSKNEAAYWLTLVKTVDGFGESYVSMTKAKR